MNQKEQNFQIYSGITYSWIEYMYEKLHSFKVSIYFRIVIWNKCFFVIKSLAVA